MSSKTPHFTPHFFFASGLLTAVSFFSSSCDFTPDLPPAYAKNRCSLSEPTSEECSKRYPLSPHMSCRSPGFCSADTGDFEFVVTISLPNTSLFAPGFFFLFSRSELPYQKTRNCTASSCLILPRLDLVQGRYEVSPETQSELNYALGVSGPGNVVLPAQVSFRPIFPFESRMVDVSRLGITLPVLFAKATNKPPTTTSRGPAFGNVQEYSVLLPPNLKYQVQAVPLDPFSNIFPPRFEPFANIEAVFLLGPSGRNLDPLPPRSARVVSDVVPLDGFSLWLEDRFLKQKVSNVAKLSGFDAVSQLVTVGQGISVPTNMDLVLMPKKPDESSIKLVVPVVTGALPKLRYPAFDLPIKVSGKVTGVAPQNQGQNGVEAPRPRLLFKSEKVATRSGDFPEDLLHFQDSVGVDSEGNFEKILPKGTYTIYMLRDAAHETSPSQQQFAKTVKEHVELREDTNLHLVMKNKLRVTGFAKYADSQGAASAKVEFFPAAETNLTELPLFAYPAQGVAYAHSDGAFELDLDPGLYDIYVSPTEDSFYPRAVFASFELTKEGALADLVISPPELLELTIQNPSLLRVSRPLVRVFSIPKGSKTYVEIASGLGDEQGFVRLLLQKPNMYSTDIYAPLP